MADTTDIVLGQLFTEARSHNGWLSDEPIEESALRQLYDLTKYGPTSANCSPARFTFVVSKAAKAKLAPTLSKGNLEKTMSAPVTVIAAWDKEFYEKLPELFPHGDARSWFTTSPAMAEETAFRNASMQSAYFIMAVRSLGLDAGPMSGFDRSAVDRLFFEGRTWVSNLLINVGHGDKTKIFPRLPRLPFEEACSVE